MKNNFIFRSIEACNDFSDRIEIIRMSLIYIHIHQYLKLNFSVNHLESPVMMWIKSNKSRLDQMIDQWFTFAIDDFVQIFHRQHHKWIHNFGNINSWIMEHLHSPSKSSEWSMNQNSFENETWWLRTSYTDYWHKTIRNIFPNFFCTWII